MSYGARRQKDKSGKAATTILRMGRRDRVHLRVLWAAFPARKDRSETSGMHGVALIVTAALEELLEPGPDTTQPLLFVLDGAKALAAVVQRVCGREALIQRCHLHKQRNVNR